MELDKSEKVLTPSLKPIEDENITSLSLVKVVAGGVFGWSTVTTVTKGKRIVSQSWTEPQQWTIAFDEHKVKVYDIFCRDI